MTKFRTKVGRLSYNVREIITATDAGKVVQYQSSLGYAASLAEAKEMACRDASRHTQVVNASGAVKFEHKPAPIARATAE